MMLTIVTLLLTPKFCATTLCVKNVSNFTIGLQRRIADVLMSKGETNTGTYELDCTVGKSKLYYCMMIRQCYSYP